MLSCGAGTFTGVKFASYGTPLTGAGNCSYTVGACNAPSSAAVVGAACVGRSTCAIDVGVGTFGPDPCSGVYKFLAVQMEGACAPAPAGALCALSTYSRTFRHVNASGTGQAYYQRLMPRNDAPAPRAIPYALNPPTGGVTLNGGVLGAASDAAVKYLLGVYTVDNLLFNFRKRAGLPQPPGAHCMGWDCREDWCVFCRGGRNKRRTKLAGQQRAHPHSPPPPPPPRCRIEGSPAGLFLMGAGGHLRWREIPALRAMMDALIDGIEACAEPDGWLSAYTQAKMATDEHPDYTTSWTVHGFLEAAVAGNAKALPMIRRHMNVFNNHSLIPSFLPGDGGNWPWQVPAGPWPPGANNATSSGSGTLTGHTIYLIVQGIIHSTRLALSPVGTQADVDLVKNLYEEPWWLAALAARDETVVGHKLFFSHNYQLTGVEAYMDMYFLTGEQLYLDAVLGAWAMHRDTARGWILLGGSLAINEGDIYEPGSFHLEAGTNRAGLGLLPRERARLHRGRLAGERHHGGSGGDNHTCAGEEHGGHGTGRQQQHHGHHHGLSEGWDAEYPTGEFCGAVFWLKLNQRLHQLQPDNETFVAEIEREVYNEGLAHLAPDGSGIRYFSFLNGVKQEPAAISTCCEGQGTRLYGSLQEYLFATTPSGALYVDIYAPATFNFSTASAAGTLQVFTDFPYGSDVRISLTLAQPAASLDLALRMPSWLAAPSVPVTVGGAPWPAAGAPGTYLHLSQAWPAGETLIAFTLPQAVTAHLYTGVTQLGGYVRYGFTHGPTLLAATPAGGEAPGHFNSTLRGMVIPGVRGAEPASWLVPAADGSPLHWEVVGVPGVLFQPSWEIQEANFSAFPCFDS